MSTNQAAKGKPPIWETIRAAWRPYKRLYGYVHPYKWRFVVGLVSGFAFGVISSSLPLVLANVMSFLFHGAVPNPMAVRSHPEIFFGGPKVNSIAIISLLIPLVMAARSLSGYVNAYYMQWVSNKVVTDIRTELFNKIARHSMDFFNKMPAGFLISRITNDTRGMQRCIQTAGHDSWRDFRAPLHGLEIHGGDANAFSDLHGADPDLRQTRAQSRAA
jgi:ABC-type multidrug transport system fused ATPase/permease subunit